MGKTKKTKLGDSMVVEDKTETGQCTKRYRVVSADDSYDGWGWIFWDYDRYIVEVSHCNLDSDDLRDLTEFLDKLTKEHRPTGPLWAAQGLSL